MRTKFIIGAASGALALLGFSSAAQAQSTIGSRLGGNEDAVLTIDRSTGSPLEASTTDPLAILGLQSHSATPTDVLVMEGDMVRTFPFATVSGTSTMTGPDAAGNYTHTGADGTATTIEMPDFTETAGIYTYDPTPSDGSNGDEITIAPAIPATSSLAEMVPGSGIYTHSDGAAVPTETTFDVTNAWHPASDSSASAVGSTAEDIWFDAGQVGIGIVPTQQLHVAGNALLTGNLFTNSDRRLKTEIEPFESSLDALMEMEPVSFYWIDEAAHDVGKQVGFIAQDVQAALPEAVVVSEDEMGTLSISDRPILAASVGAIRELKAENDALKASNEALIAEVTEIRAKMDQMELLQLAVMSLQAQLADMAQQDAVMKANFSL